MTERGTGRTLAMVKELPEGDCIVIVHCGALRDYVSRMIRDVRGPVIAGLARVYVVRNMLDVNRALDGRSRWPVFVDHAFDEHDVQNVGPLIRDMVHAGNTASTGWVS